MTRRNKKEGRVKVYYERQSKTNRSMIVLRLKFIEFRGI
jgi:hypothetical protein